jgi:hypothetical protein
MIADKDIWQVARLMIRAHGDHAEKAASEHVDERLAQGDWIGRISGGRSSPRPKSYTG